MQHHQDWSIQVLKNPILQQIAPLVVILVVPFIVYLSVAQIRQLNFDRVIYTINKILSMVLDGLGISLPWLWGGQQKVPSTSTSRIRKHRRKSSSAKVVRARTEQIALQKTSKEAPPAIHNSESDFDDVQYYPGLINISGTYCFMNSTLQAMASLSYLQPHIDAIHARAEALDVPTPVIDALQELFKNLNTPKSSYHTLRPHNIIHALSSPPSDPNSTENFRPRTSYSLFNSREHQDAQELFQLVSECIKNEMSAVDREGLRDRGIANVLQLGGPSSPENRDSTKDTLKTSNKSVFEGLTANRRSCVMCGYTEAVMHFGFDNWQLAVPRLATSCRLEDCLEDYTRLEILKDCICRKCSVLATHKRLLAEMKTLEEALAPSTPLSASLSTSVDTPIPRSPQKPKPSQSKKKRYKEVKKMEHRVHTALDEGRIEDEALLEGVRLEKVISPASTKQAMIARPPLVLALHLNRSVHYGQYAAKNTIRVYFPEVLDLTPFTTSGSLSTIPTNAISTPSPTTPTSTSVFQDKTTSEQPRRPTTPTQETYTTATQRTIYRLAAIVCHYGQHSFGHYICYRRKPRRSPNGDRVWVPPALVDPLKGEETEGEPDDGVDGDVETETDGDGTLRLKKGTKANGSAKSRLSAVDLFGLGGGPKYCWDDHSETEVGTNKGWLRISDDSVEECGIERVLAEASGAFMLYYEKAVHPKAGLYSHPGPRGSENGRIPNGDGRRSRSRSRSRGRSRSRSVLTANGNATESEEGDVDADGFSIGSEETLKPQLKVMDLNGSVGSLISEVGVGVMKKEKPSKVKAEKEKEKEKEKDRMSEMSMSLYSSGSSTLSSKGVGARIIRNVSAGQWRLPTKQNGNGLHSSLSDLGSSDDLLAPTLSASAPTTSFVRSPSQKSAHNGFGSKSTRVIHHPPQSPSGVRTR